MLNEENRPTLPFSKFGDMKNPRWSFLYAYNLRTVRDIFAYCALKEKVNEEELYRVMREMKIPPPKDRWIHPHSRRKERLRLEYIHAARYLGLIKKVGDSFVPNFSDFEKEEKIIIQENRTRSFKPSKDSPPFTEKEKKSLLKIVLDYERARDFLWWFLDFSRFPDTRSFDENDFRRYAKTIFILGKIRRGKKGSEILKREIDGRTWKIPDSKPYDYTRLASFVFPSWFKELGLIDEVIVFREFSEDGKLWHMYYPIIMSEAQFMELDIFRILRSLSLEQKTDRIWIPFLLYVLARKYKCSIKAIKTGIEKAYRKHAGALYLERVPSRLMRRRYRDSYIEVGGFQRSYLKLPRVIEDG